MKSLSIKNGFGETIEIKRDSDGKIKIRHSDIDPKLWGELRESTTRLSDPRFQSFLKKKGTDISGMDPKILAALEGVIKAEIGHFILLGGKIYNISSDEITMITEAIKTL